MNVLWSKEKYQKIFSTDNIVFHASGDAAADERCCRLCGGDASLRAAGDTYTCDGVEERYDKLLFDCFGVIMSPPDSLLCEWCVRQLQNTDKFRALVHAALYNPLSSISLLQDSKRNTPKNQKKHNPEAAVISYRDIIDLLNNKTADSTDRYRKRKITEKNNLNLNHKINAKRTNVQCVVCKQSYPVYLREIMQEFVCSRCTNNNYLYKNDAALPKSVRRKQIKMHGKFDLRGKNRRLGSPKTTSQIKYKEMHKTHGIPKYICPACPKKYMTSQHLTEHLKCMHGNKRKSFCEICGMDYRIEPFDKHIRIHSEPLHEKKVIKSKHGLKTHLSAGNM